MTLIALNPFKNVDYLYSKNLIEFYDKYYSTQSLNINKNNNKNEDVDRSSNQQNNLKEKLLLNNFNLQTEATTCDDNLNKLLNIPPKPHIFKYASIAWKNLDDYFNNFQHKLTNFGNVEKNQTIIVSGVSGSGKTRTISYIMYYFTHILNTNRAKSIENVLLLANVILESFGNAKTLHNDNSSRFGKYIQLHFSNNKLLYNVKINTYLLEKTRVLNDIQNERNFHIFYQLIAGTTEQQKHQWGLNDVLVKKMLQLNMNESTINDSIKWQLLQNAFNQLRIRNIEKIYKIIIAIAHLSCCTFTYENQKPSNCDIDRLNVILNPKTSLHLDHAASLLGFKTAYLENCLLTQELIISQDSKRKNTKITKKCNLNEVKSRKDSLLKLIYSSLFIWLVNKINENLNKILIDNFDKNDTAKKYQQAYIGLLDMYGFENNIQSNSLEQLCINYANERLHQIYIESFLKFTQYDYIIENIKWSKIRYNDNLNLIKTLDNGTNCLFNILNEESRLKRNLTIQHSTSDSSVTTTTTSCSAYKLSTKIVNRLRNNDYIKFISQKQTTELFLIKHYAGDVNYNIDYNLIEKNKDQISNDLILFLSKTDNNYLIEILQLNTLNQNHNRKQFTVLKKFKQNLDELIDIIKLTKVHYIKCIKPNENFHSGFFDRLYVLNQLESCGILATINLYQLGYTNKYNYYDFLYKYLPILIIKKFNRFDNDVCDVNIQEFRRKLLKSTSLLLLLTKSINNYHLLNNNNNSFDGDADQTDNDVTLSSNFSFDDTISCSSYQSFNASRTSGTHCVENLKELLNNMKVLSEKIVRKMISRENDNDLYQLGKTKIFFKDKLASMLDSQLDAVRNEAVFRISRLWKVYKMKKRMLLLLKVPPAIKTSSFSLLMLLNDSPKGRKKMIRKCKSCPIELCKETKEYFHKPELIILEEKCSKSSSNISKYTECFSYSELSLTKFCLSSKCNVDDSETHFFHASDSFKIISKRNVKKSKVNIMTLSDCI